MMTETKEKVRYTKSELEEFEAIIKEKLDEAKAELKRLKSQLSRRNDSGTDNTTGGIRSIEDGIESSEKEEMMQQAARINKYVNHLEKAIIRIKNGTYGICIQTGKLIPKERLRVVPHTQHSIEAKLNRP